MLPSVFTPKQCRRAKFAKYPLLVLLMAGIERSLADENDYFADYQGYIASSAKIRYTINENGDIIPTVMIPPVFCFSKIKHRSKKAQHKYYEQYYKMIYNLKITYPYAQIIKHRLAEIDRQYLLLNTDRERKAYIKNVEKKLFAEFQPIARKMTISQGKMLIKLVNRETGKTGYVIVKELKGTLNAFFWQTVARMFNQTLKAEFDPQNDDKILNELIYLYENGWL